MTKPDNTYKLMKTGELLPLGFVPEALEEERISQMAWYILRFFSLLELVQHYPMLLYYFWQLSKPVFKSRNNFIIVAVGMK